MKVSMDGMRHNSTGAVNSLQATVLEAVGKLREGLTEDTELADELIEKFNDVASAVGIFNCVFHDEIEGDFNDLSNTLTVNFIEED